MNDLEYLTQKYLTDNDEEEVVRNRIPINENTEAPQSRAPINRAPAREGVPVKTIKSSEPDVVALGENQEVKRERYQSKSKTKGKAKSQAKSRRDIQGEDPRNTAKKPNYVGRFFLCLATLIMMVLITVCVGCLVISYGPSPTVRNMCVLSAKQASATKWVPDLFLSKEVVNEIMTASDNISSDVVSIEDIATEEDDEWEDAIDGMKLIFRQEPNFKAYVLLIKDPSRVKLGVSSENFGSATEGMRIFDIAEKYKCVAAINGGEFSDPGGQGTGAQPIGITYSDGTCRWQSATSGTFIGLDKDNNLICVEGMNQTKGAEMNIRDGCCFMRGNVIIERDGDDNVKLNYADDNLGVAQKTAIGQRADGTIIMIVTDGRSTDSIGATRNAMIDLMVEYGAVIAGSLDGGSSSMLYYRDYFNTYNMDKSTLDEYQQLGLVNHYKAFTKPRRIPTYFIVMPGE